MRRYARHLVLATACAVLGACQPLASFRPASGIGADRDVEVGFGAGALGSKPFAVQGKLSGSGQLWISSEAADWLLLTGVLAIGETRRAPQTAVAAGAAARVQAVELDRFALGAELELGWLWGALLVPMALRLFDETWLYAAPRFGSFGDELSAGFLAGISLHLHGGVFLRAETQWTWPRLDPFERRIYAGGALAVQL